MNIIETHSHFNGLEYLQVHKPQILDEIWNAVQEMSCDVNELESSFSHLLAGKDWQKIGSADNSQMNFVKNRIAITLQMGSPQPPACDFFAQHLAAYVCDQIDVGVEILPMKSLQIQMSFGPSYYEGELYNVIRQGRGVPGVPLILIGVDA